MFCIFCLILSFNVASAFLCYQALFEAELLHDRKQREVDEAKQVAEEKEQQLKRQLEESEETVRNANAVIENLLQLGYNNTGKL